MTDIRERRGGPMARRATVSAPKATNGCYCIVMTSLIRVPWALSATLLLGCATDGGAEGTADDGATSSAESSPGDGASSSTSPQDPSSGPPTSGTDGGAHCDGVVGTTTTGGGSSDDASDSTGDGFGGMDDDMPLESLTAEIRQAELGPGQRVLVANVVVTSRPAPNEYRSGWDIFVQDQGGGPWSGLRVRFPLDPGDTFEIGDAVDVVGRVQHYRGYYSVDIKSGTDGVEVIGAGTPPAPPVISVEDLTLDSDISPSYESMPIRVEQVIVTNEDTCAGEFTVEDVVRIDDRFAPGQLAVPVQGSTVSVGGMLVFAEDAFEVAPRDPSELEVGE